jgi:hypothetical protein
VRFRLPHRELFDASNLNIDGEITQDPGAIQYRKGDRLWHTDSAFMEKRTSYSLLLAHSVPARRRGRPSFADTRSAYDDLPQDMKDFLEDKVGINTLWWSRKMAGADIPDEGDRRAPEGAASAGPRAQGLGPQGAVHRRAHDGRRGPAQGRRPRADPATDRARDAAAVHLQRELERRRHGHLGQLVLDAPRR